MPVGHTARLVYEVVDDMWDLRAVDAAYTNGTGAPPFSPLMMLQVVVSASSSGVTLGRVIERRCQFNVAFRWLSTNTKPDYKSLSKFCLRHLDASDDLFGHVLVLCTNAGLVKLARVVLDCTNAVRSASRPTALSYCRLVRRIPEIEADWELTTT